MTKIHVSTLKTSIASLGCQATITELDKTTDVDFALNVSRRHETVLYRKLNKETAHIGFINSKKPLSSQNLYITDRSSVLAANQIAGLDEPVNTENIITYPVPTDRFAVTDVYSAEDNDNSSNPLFYQHVISEVNLPRRLNSYTIESGYSLTAVELLDINFSPINTDATKIDWDTGIVYNNLVSSFDQATGNAVAYYVRYSVKNSVDLIVVFTELVSNELIFSEAEPSDLDAHLNIIDDGRKVYLIHHLDDALQVSLPHIGNYAFQVLDDTKIQLIPPPEADIEDPWYVSVTNGRFTSIRNGISYQYAIEEFLNQAWDPYEPFKASTFENSNFVSDRLVKLNRSNINVDPTQSGYLSLLIYDGDDEPVAAFTTYTGLSGTVAENSELYQTWTSVERTGIRSIDAQNGLVDIDGLRLRSDYRIIGSYLYNEANYEVTALDFNPYRSIDLRAKIVGFFVKPTTSSESASQTLFFTVADASGKIVKSNLPNFDNTDEKLKTSDDIWRNVYYEAVPEYITTDTGCIMFMTSQTVIGSGLYLPLGEVSVSEDTAPDQSTILDTRIRGGGIKEGSVETARVLQREVKWYWDVGFWDGVPFPGTASYFIEVPVSVLETAGGTFQTDQVRDIIGRHTAAGVYAVAKAYGIDPVISGVNVSGETIDIAWSSEPNYYFDVFTSLNSLGPWTKVTPAPVANNTAGNQYSVYNLTNGVNYYIMVAAGTYVDGNFVYESSQPLLVGASPGLTVFGKNVIGAKPILME